MRKTESKVRRDPKVFFASTFWRKLQRKMEKVESPKWRILQMSRAGVFQPGIYKHSSVFTGYMKVDTYGKIQQTVALHR